MNNNGSAPRTRWMAWAVAGVVALVGLAMVAGGGLLLSLGGSAYYLPAGALLLAVAVSHARGSRWALRLVLAYLVITVAWSAWETGGIGWGLLPRLGLPIVLALLVGAGAIRAASRRPLRVAVSGGAAVLAVLALAIALTSGDAGLQGAPAIAPVSAVASGVDHWSVVGGDLGGTKHARLDQITPANVARLRPLWTYTLRDNPQIGKGGLQATPIEVDGALYLCSSTNDVIALDGESGRELWRYRAHSDTRGVLSAGCRGVAYYRVPGAIGPCAERIVTNTVDARLIAVDRATGQACRDFGRDGVVSLLTGMGRKIPGYYYPTSAPLIAGDRVILGGWVTDSQFWGEPSGAVRAFDARTGAFAWAFDAGRPNDHGEPAPGNTYTLSTPNAWGPMSADEKLGLAYLPMGNPTPDYFGAQRRPFDEATGSAIVALDLRTGALRWRFQTVHHDLWDYDLAAQPMLVDLVVGDRPRHALIQLTKRGETFLLDRETGVPIAPVIERPAPQAGAAPGERLSPTQPYSLLPSVRGPVLTEASMWGLTPLDQLWCRVRFRQARYAGIFTPPGLTPSINFPGFLGGTNWGGGTWDSATGLLTFNKSNVPVYVQLVPRARADAMGVVTASPEVSANMAIFAQKFTPYAVSVKPFLSPLGIPCNAPPFGELVAMDLAHGRIAWSRPLGTTRDAGPFGVPSHLPLATGMPNTGGPISTAGGVTFVAATQDATLRAFATATGNLLWSARLPAGGQATPMTFRAPRSRRQIVVVAAGGNRLLGSKLGNYVVAYAIDR